MQYLDRAAPPFATVPNLLGVGGGIYSLINPVAFSDALGIPFTSPSSPAVPFVSFEGGRNLTSGITIFTLLYNGQRKALGLVLMSGVVTSMVDAWICTRYGSKEGKAVGHVVVGILIGITGGALYWQ